MHQRLKASVCLKPFSQSRGWRREALQHAWSRNVDRMVCPMFPIGIHVNIHVGKLRKTMLREQHDWLAHPTSVVLHGALFFSQIVVYARLPASFSGKCFSQRFVFIYPNSVLRLCRMSGPCKGSRSKLLTSVTRCGLCVSVLADLGRNLVTVSSAVM